MQDLTIMAVRAHPDDEHSVGGTLARYAAEGVNTVLVTCTNGEEGEIVDPDMDPAEIKPRLGDVRLGELNAAVGVLGIRHLELLGYRDSGMAGTPANDDPRSFNKADFDEATRRLVALVRQYRPQVLVTDNEEGGYGHPDHIMAHRITMAAFDAAGDPAYAPGEGEPWTPQKLYYPAWMIRSRFQAFWRALRERGLPTFWGEPDAEEPPARGTPDELVTACIDIGPYMTLKRDALRAHRTQIRRDSPWLSVPEDLARQYLGVEGFQRARSRVPTPELEDDLFAGLREPVGSTQ